jgi:molybdopterin biosynthesis enzyme MoaB
VARQAEELKDSIIDLVLSARQRDEIWGEVSADAQQRHEDRCQKEAKRLEELVAALGGTGPARHSITVEQLQQAQQSRRRTLMLPVPCWWRRESAW